MSTNLMCNHLPDSHTDNHHSPAAFRALGGDQAAGTITVDWWIPALTCIPYGGTSNEFKVRQEATPTPSLVERSINKYASSGMALATPTSPIS